MFLEDQMTASYFDLNKRRMLGDIIVPGFEGFNDFKVQIKEEEKLEDDPENPCIDYKV